MCSYAPFYSILPLGSSHYSDVNHRRLVLTSLGLRMSGITSTTLQCLVSLTPHFFFWRFILLCASLVRSFFRLCTIPLTEYAIVCFSILLLTDIWNISVLRTLWVKILRAACMYTFAYISLECVTRRAISGSWVGIHLA